MDKLRIKDKEFVGIVYPFLGGVNVITLTNPKEKEVLMKVLEASEFSDVILTTSYFPELAKLRINVVNVKEEFKKSLMLKLIRLTFQKKL